MFTIENGWLHPARHLPSPNCDARPAGRPIDLLVIHNISLPAGAFGGPWIDDLFLNRLEPNAHPSFPPLAPLRVSAHLLIRRNGAIHQYVPFHLRAWHAGVSSFRGETNCNDYSIGIELEGSDQIPYTEPQYSHLLAVTTTLMAHYPALQRERISGHSDIAPGRKSDPGPAFDWQRYLAGVNR